MQLSYEERMKEKVVRMLGEEYLLPFMDIFNDECCSGKVCIGHIQTVGPTCLVIRAPPHNYPSLLHRSSHFLHYLSLASCAGVNCAHVWVTSRMNGVNQMKVVKLTSHLSLVQPQPSCFFCMNSNYINANIGVTQLLTCDLTVFSISCCGFLCCMPLFPFLHVVCAY